jgi:hypothetical protein
LHQREIEAFGYVLGWLEDWRVEQDLPPGREAARHWWAVVAKSMERLAWQPRLWEEAIRWYLAWLDVCRNDKILPFPQHELGLPVL